MFRTQVYVSHILPYLLRNIMNKAGVWLTIGHHCFVWNSAPSFTRFLFHTLIVTELGVGAVLKETTHRIILFYMEEFHRI